MPDLYISDAMPRSGRNEKSRRAEATLPQEGIDFKLVAHMWSKYTESEEKLLSLFTFYLLLS